MSNALGTQLRSIATRAGLVARGFDPSDFFDLLGRHHANRELLVFTQRRMPFRGFDGPSLTGDQLRALGYKLANTLVGYGVRVNDRVLIVKRNHADYFIYENAVIAAGGIPVAVNQRTGWSFISTIQKLTAATVVLTDAETLALCAADASADAGARAWLEQGATILVLSPAPSGARAHVHGSLHYVLDEVAGASSQRPKPRTMGNDTPVALFHTSGTTGTPKLCIWDRRNVMRIWKILLGLLPVSVGSRALSVAPFSHQITFAAAAPTLLAGARTYVMEDFEPRACLQIIQDERISRVLAFPYHYMRMAAEDLDAYDLSAMRFWLAGADKVHAAHIAKFIARGGLRMYPGGPRGSGFCDTYGSTEIGVGGTMQIWLPGSRPVPCLQGRPMPTQFKIRITDKTWNDVAGPEQPGRILVRSSTYFGGYWNAHDRWSASRIDGWWWGGDVGKLDKQGRLHFLDREEDSVRSAEGIAFTLPIEERLLEHPRVMEAAVYQYDTDERTGLGKAAAVVVPVGWLTSEDIPHVTDEERRTLALELLEWASVAQAGGPSLSAVRVVPLSQLAIGVTGKVLKRTLRDGAQASACELVTRRDRQTVAPMRGAQEPVSA